MTSRTSRQRPTLWIATRNRGKTREFQAMLGKSWKVGDLHALPRMKEIRETGRTFQANAKIKALAVSLALPGRLVLADDSGLVVEALGGRPGVRSARFSGPRSNDERNRKKLLRLMQKMPKGRRHAYFQTTLVLARSGRFLGARTGRVWGRITESEQGSGGFGYDPIFMPIGYAKTFGQLSGRTKDRISHRAKAVQGIKSLLSRYEHPSRMTKYI
ncbi:MAG: RdgB/HAM1 family non-canonical purine NTP pyrophosphatase [Verrucomicrobia bacterium]|nr:RdgB/HAM1 family non-canonical purine NTP pyrophosphatase [Verrucomicrobiota bacterium]